MTKKRTSQFLIGIFAVVSLLASSIAACACSHHHETAKVEVSCHEHSETSSQEKNKVKSNRISCVDECICMLATPKVLAKSESVKLGKTAATISTALEPETKSHLTIRVFEPSFVETTFRPELYYSSKTPRGPPVS